MQVLNERALYVSAWIAPQSLTAFLIIVDGFGKAQHNRISRFVLRLELRLDVEVRLDALLGLRLGSAMSLHG